MGEMRGVDISKEGKPTQKETAVKSPFGRFPTSPHTHSQWAKVTQETERGTNLNFTAATTTAATL